MYLVTLGACNNFFEVSRHCQPQFSVISLISGSERELRQLETGEPEEEAERAADHREHGELVGHDHLHRLQDIRRLVEDVDGRRVVHLPRRVDLRVELVARGSIGKYELKLGTSKTRIPGFPKNRIFPAFRNV